MQHAKRMESKLLRMGSGASHIRGQKGVSQYFDPPMMTVARKTTPLKVCFTLRCVPTMHLMQADETTSIRRCQYAVTLSCQ